MPAFDQTDLQQTFLQLRTLFNASDYEAMRPLLHLDIIWKRLHHAESIVSVAQVIQWLKDQKASPSPQFNPDLNKAQTTSLGDGSQQIGGPALWQAQKNGSNETIEYHFTFTTDRAGRWLLINAFGRIIP